MDAKPLKVAALAGLGAVFFALSKAAAATPPPSEIRTPADVKQLAASLIDKYGFNVSPCMATAIAIIESGDVNNPANGFNAMASRYEPDLGDYSLGLMQVLSSNMPWLYNIGYNAYGTPQPQALFTPEVSMYFGLAELDWLSRWNGSARGEAWIVQSYNAGAGHASSLYLMKYNEAMQWLQESGIC